MLTVDDYKMILEHIEGLVVVDHQARILFMNRRLAEDVGFAQDETVGKHIKDVIATTKVHLAVETQEPALADFYFLNEETIVSTRHPMRKGDVFVGVVEYDLFDNYKLLKNFLKKADSLSNELSYFKQEQKRLQGNKYSIDNIFGESLAIRKLRREIVHAAQSNSTVLIHGETGSGKELVAHSIHALGDRTRGSFVRLNCSAIPFELFESELFGFEEGSFTNARKGGKTGKFQVAHDGTLFLDEINQLPLSLQPKILRALQEKEIDKIGGKYSVAVDARVICATNQDLRELVAKGLFREDLYYRLNVIQIRVPPLRERKEDIPSLVQSCMENLNHFLKRDVQAVSPDALSMLMAYDWPGNVRELQNTLERVMNSVDFSVRCLEVSHFEPFQEGTLVAKPSFNLPEGQNPLEAIKSQAERDAIIQVLQMCNGNKSAAAKILKISRPLLYQKMKRLQIDHLRILPIFE